MPGKRLGGECVAAPPPACTLPAVVGLRRLRLVEDLGGAKVCQFDVHLVVQQDVLWFDVAVHRTRQQVGSIAREVRSCIHVHRLVPWPAAVPMDHLHRVQVLERGQDLRRVETRRRLVKGARL